MKGVNSGVRRRRLAKGERIRVLVVDDSAVMRRLISQVLSEDCTFEVVGVAGNGAIALQRIAQLQPDLLTLDVEMPEMDGLETLRQLRQKAIDVRVIMFSTLTERGGVTTLEALSLGADDYVAKPSGEISLEQSLRRLKTELIPKAQQLFAVVPAATVVERERGGVSRMQARPQAVAIGASTGGPNALGELLPTLPANLSVPVFVVQHMPPLFTRLLAERLQTLCKLQVAEAIHGEPVTHGRVYLAPGDFHMKISRSKSGNTILLDQSPALNSCRPAVDSLFLSVADVFGGAAIAAVLTGMGQDGLNGARAMRALGAHILAQDEASSIVWGMPGAVALNGLADQVLPLAKVSPEIIRLIGQA